MAFKFVKLLASRSMSPIEALLPFRNVAWLNGPVKIWDRSSPRPESAASKDCRFCSLCACASSTSAAPPRSTARSGQTPGVSPSMKTLRSPAGVKEMRHVRPTWSYLLVVIFLVMCFGLFLGCFLLLFLLCFFMHTHTHFL